MAEITIKDIAKQCGVGISTVSRAINNHPDINPETKAMIMQTIKEVGFIPNNSARNLKRMDAKCIAVLVKGITNMFFADMIQIIEEEIQRKKYAMVLHHVEAYEDEVEVALELIKEKRLRGIIFLGGAFSHNEAQLKKINVPFVFSAIGLAQVDEGKKKTYSNIAVDDCAESKKLVEYLIQMGHRKIAIITEGTEEPSVGQLRLEGYRQALEAAGIPVKEELIRYVEEDIDHYSMENGYLTTKRLIREKEPFTAIFAIADAIALGACRAIYEEGLRIPEDVTVVGYDGIKMGEYITPQLTTIRQPVKEMAQMTIKLLFDVIAGNSSHAHIIFPAELIIRESSGKASE